MKEQAGGKAKGKDKYDKGKTISKIQNKNKIPKGSKDSNSCESKSRGEKPKTRTK